MDTVDKMDTMDRLRTPRGIALAAKPLCAVHAFFDSLLVSRVSS
jgi:hypothetical protein